ncbi:hypothetical protein BDV25DRAFT_168430 [Aspergillus avenaceus]|uniref:Yeast cell wall synthesis Kre9/Knh1-like N-terminal domain-containing protein n=1 Tax=Aspergillus avenaceus TaxID=36643 RepID=A0A5N6TPY6_ASPAV|nr:hypothetical protein BDV25DRAFT_168430 [Aspergillus avenaceus]
MYVFEGVFGALLCLAHVGVVEAVAFTQWPSTIYAGEPATVDWVGDPNVPTTIILRKGAAKHLDDVEVLTTEGRGGTFTWTPSEEIADGTDYALQIQQAASINYSGHVTVVHAQAPLSKGPPPDRDPNSPNFDTAPHRSELGVAKGNNATHSNNTTEGTPTTGNDHTSAKSAVAAKMQTGDASLRIISAPLVLAAAAAFYFAC